LAAQEKASLWKKAASRSGSAADAVNGKSAATVKPIYFAAFVFPLPFCPFDGLVEAAISGAGVATLTRAMIKHPDRIIPMMIALTLM